MHYILLLFALFLTACNTTPILEDTPTPVVSTAPVATTTVSATPVSTVSAQPVLPVSNQDNDENDLKIVDEDSIVGNYVLNRGMFRNQEITEGYLVVEELDVDNYGYYYVTIADKLLPETHTGIFYKKGGEFVQKVIEDSSDVEIHQGKPKSKISIIDNVRITQKDNLLKIFIDSDKQEKLIWKRDVDNFEKSQAMIETLKNARHEYIKYYKEKCQKNSSFCGNDAYTKVNE
jgi:hypothetical protein